MSDTPTRAEITSRLETAEARVDTKFAQLVGEMRTGFAEINTRLQGVERSTGGIKATVIVTGLGAVGLVIAVLAYGQSWFGLGMSTRDVVKAAVSEYVQQHPTPPQK